MRVLSLFDGISCGMVALERAGIPVEAYDAFEIDQYAVKVSEKTTLRSDIMEMCLRVISEISRDMICFWVVLPVHTGLSQSKAEKLQATVKASNFFSDM